MAGVAVTVGRRITHLDATAIGTEDGRPKRRFEPQVLKEISKRVGYHVRRLSHAIDDDNSRHRGLDGARHPELSAMAAEARNAVPLDGGIAICTYTRFEPGERRLLDVRIGLGIGAPR